MSFGDVPSAITDIERWEEIVGVVVCTPDCVGSEDGVPSCPLLLTDDGWKEDREAERRTRASLIL